MRRVLPLCVLLTVPVLPFVACASTRDRAHDDLVDQLVDEGGLDRSVADCVVDGFFEHRSTEELKAFFERDGLTEAERLEFARLGDACTTAS